MTKGKTVLASGAFDLLHYGHLSFLEEAKRSGGKNARLVVIVARDSAVEARKGRKPVIPEDQRTALIQALKIVDKAILGFEDLDLEKVIERMKPSVIVFGYDQTDLKKRVEEIVRRKNLTLKILQASKFNSEDIDSSSKIKRRILKDARA
ncbi:MAG: adenylyltransferase/cytidyltransferase family protein [archaeon]